jgi:hypothetical protein
MDHEVEEITRCGLELLSVELLQRRLVTAQSVWALTAKQAARLLTRHQAADDNRSGRTAFVFTREQLKCQLDFKQLFRSWGGEALYNSHEDKEETGPTTKKPWYSTHCGRRTEGGECRNRHGGRPSPREYLVCSPGHCP